MTLDDLAPGTPAHIARIDWSVLADDEAKRLRALGIDTEAEVSIAHRGVLFGRDPLAVRVGVMTVALRRSHARAITIETLAAPL
ncbi:ferrous iron transport protein A [Qipengyuania sp.]|uniref:FeoA family protein n=1 Tax=Qipengyuania sp. TaxID=2004515 RepID=UPI0035C83EEC